MSAESSPYGDWIDKNEADKTAAKEAEIQANLGLNAVSLAELARLRVEEDERKATEKEQLRGIESVTLQDELAAAWYAQDIQLVRQHVADAWRLPIEHDLLTAINWQISRHRWDDATFTRNPNGKIEAKSKLFPHSSLSEVFEANIDGRRITVTVERFLDDDPQITIRGHNDYTVEPVNTLHELNAFLNPASDATD